MGLHLGNSTVASLSNAYVGQVGPPGSGALGDTVLLQTAMNAAHTAGGGLVKLAAGAYGAAGLTAYSDVHVDGAGKGLTRIVRPPGVDSDMVTSLGFSGLTGGNTSGGVTNAQFSNLTIDGNRYNADGFGGYGIRHYGALLRLSDVEIHSCKNDGIYSEWSDTAVVFGGCEGYLTNVTVHHNGGNGITWGGPHDSVWVNVIAFTNVGKGFHIKQSAAVHKAVNCHSWGNQTHAWVLEGRSYLVNCEGEGATTANLLILANHCEVKGGNWFGFTPTDKGIVIGDASHTVVGTQLDTKIENCQAGCLDLTYHGGQGQFNVKINSTGIGVLGLASNGLPLTDNGTIDVKGGATGFSGTRITGSTTGTQALTVGSGTRDVFTVNVKDLLIAIPQGAIFQGFSDVYTTETWRIDSSTGLGTLKGVKRALVTKAADYTATTADTTILASGNITITLPSAVTAGAGREYVVKNTGTGAVTIASTSGTIDTGTTFVLPVQNQAVTLVSDGTNWWVI